MLTSALPRPRIQERRKFAWRASFSVVLHAEPHCFKCQQTDSCDRPPSLPAAKGHIVVSDPGKHPDGHAKAPSQAIVVHESSCPLETWDDARRGNVVWRTLISGDRTPTAQMTLGVAEIGPGQAERFRMHRHEAAEIYYVLSGEGVVSMDGTEHPLRAGSSVFIPGNVLHGARNTGNKTLRLLYVFAADSFSGIEYVFPS